MQRMRRRRWTSTLEERSRCDIFALPSDLLSRILNDRQMCQTFLPQLSNTGRIVSLSSVASNIDIYSEEVKKRFRTAKTLEELEQIAQEFEVSKSPYDQNNHETYASARNPSEPPPKSPQALEVPSEVIT